MNIKIGDMASSDFTLIDGSHTSGEAVELVRDLGSRLLVVPGTEHSGYIIDWSEEIEKLLSKASKEFLSLTIPLTKRVEVKEVPLLESHLLYSQAPERCLVENEGIITGVFDKNRLVTIQGHRSEQSKASEDKIFTFRRFSGSGDSHADSYGWSRGGVDFGNIDPPDGVGADKSSADPQPRTRYLHTEFPEQVVRDSIRSLIVSFTEESESGRDLPFVVPSGTVIDLVLQVIEGLAIIGPSEHQVLITDKADILPVQFKVKGKEIGQGKMRLLAFKDGEALGAIVLTPTIVKKEEEKAEVATSTTLLSEPSGQVADLTMLIFEERFEGMPAIMITLHARDPKLGVTYPSFGPIKLKAESPRAIFNAFFEEIENLKVATPGDREETMLRLESRGVWLFKEIMPQPLCALLWSLKDKLQTLEIVSDEPWIPWEMCRLQGTENGEVVEGDFFCEAFEMTRWIREINYTTKLTLKNFAVIIPDDSKLHFSKDEKSYLQSLKTNDRQCLEVEANYLKVKQAFSQGTFDVIHFTGHGASRDQDPIKSCIVLENGSELKPNDLYGKSQNLGKAHPLVFLNACQSGQSGFSLTDIGGWAKPFLDAGAGAFVGTYWSIYDHGGFQFARFFYDNLLDGDTVGQATRKAREHVKKEGDPTYLAYTVYAHPGARISV